MGIKGFLKLVEIQTKVASITPLLLGSVFAYYRYGQFKWTNFILMLLSLLTFDMATTAINNYLDYRKARKTEGFGYEKHNAIVFYQLKDSSVLAVIFILLGLAVGLGLLLYLNTSAIVLIIGAISFSVGILYTFGPIPISRMPLGEIFSGFFMGFVILFLSVYIHVAEGDLMQVALKEGILNINTNLLELLVLFCTSLPAVFGISNIMLANNICDMEDDLENRRYTLPIFIGKDKSLTLFQSLYYIAFLDILILLILQVLPLTVIPVILTIVPIRRNISMFLKYQSKQDTFPLAIQNFLLVNASMILLVTLAFVL
jgi:1,4-dihydroxy-2-naphthoate octaprenyltransferase